MTTGTEPELAIPVLIEDKFATPVQGWSYTWPIRLLVALLMIGLTVGFTYVALTKPSSANLLWQMAALGAVVLATGWQILFGKTRIDSKGLHRTSFYKPHIHWFEINKVQLLGIFAKRLSVTSALGPVRFNAGTPELIEAFKKIVDHHNPLR
jgi:hypothetical protein